MANQVFEREVISDGPHVREALARLKDQINDQAAIDLILNKAVEVINQSIDPISSAPEQTDGGLLYGLIQSGKTSVITVAAALAADNGFDCVIVLTTDIDPLYKQTLKRLREALRGLNFIGKNQWREPSKFSRALRAKPVVIVSTKNGRVLHSLVEAFHLTRAAGLSVLIIDDEADQASLNTLANRPGEEVSRINRILSELRAYFPVNTYLQVTATPQALFLQRPDNKYRPTFTVLTSPGPGYIGGDFFFSEGAELRVLRAVDIREIDLLRTTNQPNPSQDIPNGLKQAVCTFFVGAASKILRGHGSSYSFLCHVSLNQRDHDHIVSILDRFKENMIRHLTNTGSDKQRDSAIQSLKNAYQDLIGTENEMPSFENILEKIIFLINGTNIQTVNATSSEEIQLISAFNLFVGGNKLGRGVTIQNLIVSYYSRNPQRPNADTVLQHARMYGYRQRDAGVIRLFLPDQLANHFRLIHRMECGLRGLVEKNPKGQFRGVFISSPLQATRRNILDPNSIGLYVAGNSYHARYPLRTSESIENTAWIDKQLMEYDGKKQHEEITIDLIIQLIKKCQTHPDYPNELWNLRTIEAALQTVKTLEGQKAYLVVLRDRDLMSVRDEHASLLSGSGQEADLAPRNAPTLFMLRINSNPGRNETAVWWPQLRFGAGNYVLAFSFDR